MSEEYQKITIPEYVEYQSLKQKLDCAVRALEFYASPDTWQNYGMGYLEPILEDREDKCSVCGKRARTALEEINKSNCSEFPISSKKEN